MLHIHIIIPHHPPLPCQQQFYLQHSASLTYLPDSSDHLDNSSTRIAFAIPSDVTVTLFSVIFGSTLDTPKYRK